jgi:hypothetical protein
MQAKKRFLGVKVKIKRAEGLPIHELVHHILVSIDWPAVASGAEKAVSACATTERPQPSAAPDYLQAIMVPGYM